MKRYQPRQVAAAVLSLLVSFLIVACEEPLPPQPAPTPTQPTPTPPAPEPEPTPPAPPPEPAPADEEYGLGLTFMDVDAYRSSYILRADPVSVPSLFDLSFDTPPPGDQGQQGSCVGWAVAYAMKSYQERVERGWPLADQRHLMSPAYVYNQIRLPGGGAYFQDAFNLLVDQGAASLAAMPYDPRDFRRAPSAAARREAANYKIASFGAVERSSHDSFVREVKRHLVQRRPVIIGIWVYPDFRRLNRSNPIYDDASGYNSGGHAIVIVGYDDARSAFKIINSWGTDWGIDGYGWIDYDASERLILEAYVVEDVIASDVNDPPAQATVPSPADAALEVASGTVEMSWTRNERTTSFDVYVGTSRELGTIDFQGNVAEPTFTAALAPGATYYWRIDARGSAGMTRGAVWSFNTSGSTQAPVAPTNPRPAHGAGDVPLNNVSLSWDSGGRATSYDVFLGTAATLQASDLVHTTATQSMSLVGQLVPGTRYYWRVDAKNGLGSTPSDTWSFTTAGAVPALSIADASATEGQALSFVVTLSPAARSTVTVSYRTANGTASSSSDYTSASGTLTFRAGETSKTISVPTTDDNLEESSETFTVGLSSASGATISDASATGTINDNDGTQPALSIADASATEGQALSFAVTLSPAASSTVTVSYRTSNGTASSSSDYTSASGTLTFAAGDTSKTISVRTTDDTSDESNETFTVQLSGATGATISDASATGTINDNDNTVPSLSIADASATEGQTLSFTVTLSPAATSTVTVSYQTHSATASGSSDYTAVSGTLTFRAGDTSKTISVRTTDDSRDESNETFTVRLSNANGATISDDSATGTINDNDNTVPSLSIADARATEGQSLSFAVTLSPAGSSTVTVSYRTSNNSASSSSDYTSTSGTLTFRAGDTRKTISVRTTSDTRDEPDETFYVRLSSASGATISDSRATGRIVDNDPQPSLSIADARATEGRDLSFTVTLSAASGRAVGVIYWTSNNSASSSTDYEWKSGTLTFQAGDTRKTISVSTTSDTHDERDETFYVRLRSATEATISDSRATGTIENDDDPGATLGSARELPRCGSGSSLWTFGGHLSRGDIDQFKFRCDKARGTLRAYTTGSTDTYGRLLHGNGGTAKLCEPGVGTEAWCRDDDRGSGDNFRVSRPGTIGTYYIKVEGASRTTTGSYALKVEWRPYDAPDSWGSAENISSLPDSRPRHLTGGSDTDWFKFRIGGSGCSTVTIKSKLDSTVSSDFSSDPQMNLYRGSGSGDSIAYNDDAGGSGQFSLSVKLRNTNTYYIKVTPYGGSSSSAGPYTLDVSRRASLTCLGVLAGA